jgi:L-lactate dehydrogenase (cytochrome)
VEVGHRIDELRETLPLMKVRRPPAPYGNERIARCYSIEDLATQARRRLPLGARNYLDGGGEGEYTLRRNRAAFDRFELVPQMPRDVSHVDLSTTVLGKRIPMPIILSPVGGPRLFHHEGELAVGRAAGAAGIPYGISTLGTTAVEDVAAVTASPLWYQLYIWGDRSDSRRAVERARAAGFRALLFSIDTNVRSKREREKRAGMDLPEPHLTVGSFLDGVLHPDWTWNFLTSDTISFPNIGPPDHRSRDKLEQMFDGTVDWPDLEWIREAWDGPILAKGVLRPEEALRAVDEGLDGVIVSNHGGRQLDHCPATIDVLGEIVEAVGDRIDVLVDSGFRRGSDILVALALGAKAVLVGRAHLYGLAAAGEAGVRHAIDILREELATAMALCGVTTIEEIDRRLIRERVTAAASDPYVVNPAAAP